MAQIDPQPATLGGAALQPTRELGPEHTVVVVIGRNEEQRLGRCLESVLRQTSQVLYVDSGSTDHSREIAEGLGVEVVALDDSRPHSVARGRNAGVERAMARFESVHHVQFLDGDCLLVDGWLEEVRDRFRQPQVAAVWGTGREERREASLFNRVCDIEWRVGPRGEIDWFIGITAISVEAYLAAGGCTEGLLAGEDTELAIKIRAAGGLILRSSKESFVHDVNMVSVRQWWKRCERTGYSYAMVNAANKDHDLLGRELRRSEIVGLAIPLASLVAAPPTRGLSLGLAPAIAARTIYKVSRQPDVVALTPGDRLVWGVHCALSQYPQAAGVLRHKWRSLRAKQHTAIEYRRPT